MRCVNLAIGAGLLTAAAAGPALAATLGFPIRPAPVISGVGAAFHDPLLGFDLLGNGLATSTAPAPADNLLVAVPFADLGPTPNGALFATQGGTGLSFLSGDLWQVSYTVDPGGDDTLKLLFRNLDGAAASASLPLAILSMTGEFGDDPIGAGFGSFAAPVEVDFAVSSAVPVPAGLPMLLSGLAGLFALRSLRRPARRQSLRPRCKAAVGSALYPSRGSDQ
jgi:hypothetical protein